jgi:enterochelin esterase-like enzyme
MRIPAPLPSLASLFASSLLVLGAVTLPAQDAEPDPTPRRNREVIWSNIPEKPHKLVTHHELQSKAMARTVGYTVYLPPGYASDTARRFPVIYFLHGSGGNENADGPAFAGIVDRMTKAGVVPPAICVFPNGGQSGYRDHPDTGINVRTMIIDELLPLVDRTYRTLPNRDSRFIAGYSMGGGGAVRLALTHPQLFSAAAAFAGGLGDRQTGQPSPEPTVETLRSQDPMVRLLLITGYDDQSTHQGHWPFVERLREAKYSFTLRTLRGVPHRLGMYYEQTGEDLVKFLMQGLAHDTAAKSP